MTPTGNPHHLAAAAAHRSEQALHRARTALSELTAAGGQITVAALARRAQVSRSFIYTQPALLEAVTRPQPPGPITPPTEQRATEQALLQRLSLAHVRNQLLTAEVDQLRAQIAALYGKLRTLKLTQPGA